MISASLSDAIEEFQDSRKARGVAAGSLRNERVVLRQFLGVVGNIFVHNVTGAHVDKWLAEYSYKAPATLNRDQTFMRQFFEWCRGRNYSRKDQDPMAGVRSRKTRLRDALFIDKEDFGKVLDAAQDGRDRIVVALGLYMFLGRAELRALRWSHVHIEDPNPELWYVQVWRQKTGKYDEKPVSEELAKELRRWRLEYGARMGEPVQPDWHVVPAFSVGTIYAGKPIPLWERTIVPDKPYWKTELTTKRVLGSLGYTEDDLMREGNHTFRRSGARALYNELVWDGSISHDGAGQIVQSMLGHSSFTTTERYLRLDLDKKRRRDILAGRPMFTVKEPAEVVQLEVPTLSEAGAGV